MLSLRTRSRDCLYLTWSFPVEWGSAPAPVLPPSLRLDSRWMTPGSGVADRSTVEASPPAGATGSSPAGEMWFLSAVLFRQEGMHLRGLPFFRLSYPQMNLRTYVVDEEGVPSVYFLGQWVPPWLAPWARLAGGGVVAAARFDAPRTPVVLSDEEVCWRVRNGVSFAAAVRIGMTHALDGGRPLGGFLSFDAAVNFLRDRPRGYTRGLTGGGLRRIDATPQTGPAVPVRAQVADSALVGAALGWAEGTTPGPPALAFLCPEILFQLQLVTLPAGRLASTAAPSPA